MHKRKNLGMKNIINDLKFDLSVITIFMFVFFMLIFPAMNLILAFL